MNAINNTNNVNNVNVTINNNSVENNLFTMCEKIYNCLCIAMGGKSQINVTFLAQAIINNINNGSLGCYGTIDNIVECVCEMYDEDYECSEYVLDDLIRQQIQDELPTKMYNKIEYTTLCYYTNPTNKYSSGEGEFVVRVQHNEAPNVYKYFVVKNYGRQYCTEVNECHVDKLIHECLMDEEWFIGAPDNCPAFNISYNYNN
jgi:hypothetical protein